MPVPDPIPSTVSDTTATNTATPCNGGIDHFQLFNNDHVSPDCPADPFAPSLLASKLTSHHLPPQPLDLSVTQKPLIPNGGLVPPLKAIPLASYYKLHRVPSLSSMSQPDAGPEDPTDVKLPRRESTAEPPEPIALNGAQNRILEQVVRTPGRQPSPQPTHLSVPGGPSQSKMLHDEGSGYVAPKFEGKESQMDQGGCLKWLFLVSCAGFTNEHSCFQ